MENQFKWGIIGPGDIAHAFAYDLQFAKSATHVVHSVLARDNNKAKKFAEEFKVPHVATNLKELTASGINAVYISTPHVAHYEQSLFCLQQKIPVLCEKPVTINVKQLRHLIEVANENDTFLLEGMWIRFLPCLKQVVSMLAVDTIGKIVTIKADISYKATYDPHSRYFNPDLGGGSLLDLGIYPVFLAILLLGKPGTIKASGVLTDSGVDGNCCALLSYESGQSTMIESSFITKTEGNATIYGEKGLIRIRNPWYEKPEGIDVEMHDGVKVFHKCEWEGKGLYFEVDELFQCLERGVIESPNYCHHFSLDVMQVLDELRKQLRVAYPAFE